MNPIYRFEFERPTSNLLNPAAITKGVQLDIGTGDTVVALAYNTTDRIPVEAGAEYKLLKSDNTLVLSDAYLCFYDSQMNYISYIFISTTEGVFEVPVNCAYTRISYNSAALDAHYFGLFSASVTTYSEYINRQVFPIYKDDLSKDFELQEGQQFFRAKLSGKLVFEEPDYSWIVSRAFDFQFLIKVYISYDAGRNWAKYWTGTFWKTDCEFDEDAKTVTVTPTTEDQYSAVLAGMEKEYDLIELTPEIAHVKADKRPMVQVYIPGQSVIGCFLSGMWWEQECESVEQDETITIADQTVNKLKDYLHFSLNKTIRIAETSGDFDPALPELFTVIDSSGERFGEFFEATAGGYTLIYEDTGNDSTRFSIKRNSDNVVLWLRDTGHYGVPPYNVTLDPVSGTGAFGTVSLYVHDMPVYARYLLDTTMIRGLQTYPIPSDDIVENNRNYGWVFGYYFPSTIHFSTTLVSTPTQWGIYQPGQYYEPPYLLWEPEFFPVSRNAWGRISVWFTFSSFDWLVEESGRKSFTIRHAYPLASVISVLLGKIAPGITHDATTVYSEFLYGVNLIGVEQTLVITPKSNIVTAGYDQSAQKAPITLKNITDMLRDCFRCYWFIDSDNRFRVEHIQYFRNGGSYSNLPSVGIDLTAQRVSRNGKTWAFAQDKFQFEKPAMAARYQFGWMDEVTQLFQGFPVDIISKYVNPDNIEQINVSRFTSDIDYVLLNPGGISKDGFVLLSAIRDKMVISNPVSGSFPGLKSVPVYGDYFNGGQVRLTLEILSLTTSGLAAVSFIRGGTLVASQTDIIIDTVGTLTIDLDNVPNGADTLRIYSIGANATYRVVSLEILTGDGILVLPYWNYRYNQSDHYLQNAYVAFCLLQQYYAFDMPAYDYTINGVQMHAQGIKRLKNQTLRFPVLNDPDLMKLIKTNLGEGEITKMSINLSSRNANVTLCYDTE